METQSHSHHSNSQPKADRILDEPRATGISPEESSVPIPEEGPAVDSVPAARSENPEHDGRPPAEGGIPVHVDLDSGRAMGRAEEIFGRAGSEAPPSVLSADERPGSWAKPLFTGIPR